jgi:hypothetical protein
VGLAKGKILERASFSELTNAGVGGIHREIEKYLYKIRSPGWGRRKEFFFFRLATGSKVSSLYTFRAWRRNLLISYIVYLSVDNLRPIRSIM